MRLSSQRRGCAGGDSEGTTYPYGGEDILELVYECNQGRVIDVDAAKHRLAAGPGVSSSSTTGERTQLG